MFRKRTKYPEGFCQCGCGNQVNWNKDKKKWNVYLTGHNILGPAHLHPRWKGGRRGGNGNYVFVYKPEHPFCDVNKLVKEERLIMEEALGRYLLPEEIIHHRNYIKDDNHLENLELFSSNSEHMRLHGKLRPPPGGWKHSDISKQKIAEAGRGRKHSDETRRKLSGIATGRKHSDETKKKISELNKGRIQSEESRQKRSDSLRGRTLSEEHKRKIGEANKMQRRRNTYGL